MYGIEAIEAINVEQLATATDRLLLRARHAKRRLSENKIVYRPAFRVDLAHEHVAVTEGEDKTELVRVPARKRFTSTTTATLLASVFAIAITVISIV
jgi:hypothetical protein